MDAAFIHFCLLVALALIFQKRLRQNVWRLNIEDVRWFEKGQQVEEGDAVIRMEGQSATKSPIVV